MEFTKAEQYLFGPAEHARRTSSLARGHLSWLVRRPPSLSHSKEVSLPLRTRRERTPNGSGGPFGRLALGRDWEEGRESKGGEEGRHWLNSVSVSPKKKPEDAQELNFAPLQRAY